MELHLALMWTGGGIGGVRLAGLSACHSRQSHDADERLLAGAAALAYGAAGARLHDLPRIGEGHLRDSGEPTIAITSINISQAEGIARRVARRLCRMDFW
jgi:hypothetical protein